MLILICACMRGRVYVYMCVCADGKILHTYESVTTNEKQYFAHDDILTTFAKSLIKKDLQSQSKEKEISCRDISTG